MAVVMVILYHGFPGIRSGGFVGVDIFFVISGYLITQLILKDCRENSFSFQRFYERRLRRIIPVLLVLMLVCSFVSWLILLPSELRRFGKTLAWSAAFLPNAYFATMEGYFDPALEFSPLLHLWSLGVEEQFYLLWPVLIFRSDRHRVTLPALLAVFLTSLAISYWGTRYDPIVHFFRLSSRGWELAAGGLLATWQHGRNAGPTVVPGGQSGHPWMVSGASLAGAGLILWGALGWTARQPIPGVWSLLPVCGAGLLIAAGTTAPVNRWILARPPLVGLGRRSYSLYLWHWSILSFTRIVLGRAPPAHWAAAEMAAALAAAYATYACIERPFRYGHPDRKSAAGLLIGLGVMSVLGVAIGADWIPARLSAPLYQAWDAATTDWRYPGEAASNEPDAPLHTLLIRSERSSKVLFIGDSHNEQYWPRVAEVIRTKRTTARSAMFVSLDGCPPLPGLNSPRPGRHCDRTFDLAIERALQSDIDTVVLIAFWERYFLGEFGIADSRHPLYSVEDQAHSALELDSAATDVSFSQLQDIVARFVASGRRVFIVLSNPTSPAFMPVLPPRLRFQRADNATLRSGEAPVDVEAFESFVAPLSARLRAVASRTGARILDPRSTLCQGDSCPASGPDGLPLYLDSNHLRGAYAQEQATFLDPVLLGAASSGAGTTEK